MVGGKGLFCYAARPSLGESVYGAPGVTGDAMRPPEGTPLGRLLEHQRALAECLAELGEEEKCMCGHSAGGALLEEADEAALGAGADRGPCKVRASRGHALLACRRAAT